MVLGESGRQVNQEHAAVAALTPQTCAYGAESPSTPNSVHVFTINPIGLVML